MFAALANIGTYGLLRFGGALLPGELALSRGALIAIGLQTRCSHRPAGQRGARLLADRARRYVLVALDSVVPSASARP